MHPAGWIAVAAAVGTVAWATSRPRKPARPPAPTPVPTYVPPAGGTSDRLQDLHPDFRWKVEEILAALEKRGFQPRTFFTWRSKEAQAKEVREGDSSVLYSYHTVQAPSGRPAALAADIIDRRWAWEGGTKAQRDSFWKALGEEAEKRGLGWGGRWRDPWDPAHVQAYPSSSGALAQLKAGTWPPPGMSAYAGQSFYDDPWDMAA